MQNITKKFVVYSLITIIVFILLFPVLWAILSSFKELKDIVVTPPKFIFQPIIDNYLTVFAREGIRSGLINSAVVCASALTLGIFFGVPSAYAIARNSGRLKQHLQFFVLSLRFLPPIAIIVPFMGLWLDFGLYDSYIALITTYLLISISVIIWMSISPFERVPSECIEAAKIDGASYMQVFFKVSLPIALPNLVGGFSFTFILLWNELLLALALTSQKATLPVAVSAIAKMGMELPWGVVNAAAVTLMLPPLALLGLLTRSMSRAFYIS